jgi:anti-sigma factor RsiW
MNLDAALKLQAWVDGQLPEAEARRVAAWVRNHPEARDLAGQLDALRSALRSAEPEYPLPLSREFYWSRIEQAIRRAQAQPVPAPTALPWQTWLLRLLAPAAILAVFALFVAAPTLRTHGHPHRLGSAEIESPLEDMSSFTFRSESEGMTVVWVNTR